MVQQYDIEAVRADFPILSRVLYEQTETSAKPLIYLDNAASAQKPRSVIETIKHCYEHQYANVHRGLHYLSQKTTDAYEAARQKVASFLGAAHSDEIVFTRGATEAFNLLARTLKHTLFKEGDDIILSVMEHHSNIVPWQLLEQEYGLKIKVVPVDDQGILDLDALHDLIGPRTKLVSITHGSNVLGTITPAKEIVRIAHDYDVPVALDGSQAVVHLPIDVQELDVDFYIFTGHKLYGPNAIGVLYGKTEWLQKMPPYQGGGEMINTVSFAGTTFKAPPARFEAGTPPIVEAIGLASAIDYVTSLGWTAIMAHENRLLTYAQEQFNTLDYVRMIGTAPNKASIVSFVVEGIHPHDLSMLLDREGIAVRAGHHCAEPLLERFGVGATTRASFGLYNTINEVEHLIQAIDQARKFLT